MSMSAVRVTSAAKAMALPPAALISAATLLALSPLRSTTATAPPRCANPIAVARPMPDQESSISVQA